MSNPPKRPKTLPPTKKQAGHEPPKLETQPVSPPPKPAEGKKK